MPKLSITLAATVLSVAIGPAAHAYSTDPVPGTLQKVSQVAVSAPQTAQMDHSCTTQIDPVLARILGLDADKDDVDAELTTVACVLEN